MQALGFEHTDKNILANIVQVAFHCADHHTRLALRPGPMRHLRFTVQVQNASENNTRHNQVCNKILAALIAKAHQLHPQHQKIHDLQLAASRLLELLRQFHGVLLLQIFHCFDKLLLERQLIHPQFILDSSGGAAECWPVPGGISRTGPRHGTYHTT